MEKKQFIITVGPTGSGKGRVLSSYSPIIQSLINDNNPDYYNKNLDDLVQESPDYIHQFNERFLKTFQDTFFENDMYTAKGTLKKTLYSEDITKMAKALDIQQKQQCFTKKRIDTLIQNPTMKDDDCARDSHIKQQMDDLYWKIRKTPNSAGDPVPIESEILLDEALKAGKNIVYEITGENLNTIKALCGYPDVGPTRFKFPGTPGYNADPLYTHEYEIILLIPYTHSWVLLSRINSRFIKQLHEYIHDYEIETGKPRSAPRIVNIKSERELINKISSIYKNIQYIIENKCVDKLFLYDNNNNPPTKILELIFENREDKEEDGQCKIDKDKRKIYKNWKRESVDIPDFTRYIGQYCGKSLQSGGANQLSNWIWTANDHAYDAIEKIFSETGQPLNNTFSFYNMSICWVYQKDGEDYYVSTIRVSGYFDGPKVTADGTTVNTKNEGIAYANTNYLQWDNKEPDSNKYVDYAGDIYNKWNTPFGFWSYGSDQYGYDKTLVLLYKFNKDKQFELKDQQICDRIVDARVFSTYELIDGGDNIMTNAIISGSTAGHLNPLRDIVYGLDKTGNCVTIPSGVDPGWKQGMVHVFSKHRKHIKKGKTNNSIDSISDMTVIHPCGSVIGQGEKNYAMMYFQHESKDRFNPNKGVLLNFHMTRPVKGVANSGLIFYFLPIDLSEKTGNPHDNLFKPSGWITINPPNSDIFVRIQDHYASQTLGNNKDLFGRISCTTPLNDIDYGKGTGKLITGVAHLKINLYTYLDQRIKKIMSEGYRSDQVLPMLQTDNIYRFYKDRMVPWLTEKVLSSDDKRAKYTGIINVQNTGFWTAHGGLPTYLRPDHNDVRALLVHDGLIAAHGGNYSIIRHLHPICIYFMIIYRVRRKDLKLHSFSNPFIINKEETASFLNFPTGLTTNNENIWLSYGDGDCKSYLACIDKDKFNRICVNDNSTPIQNIPFDLYHDPD